MSKLRIGCQTYPWKMGQHFGEVPRYLKVASNAGFKSLEMEIDMLGSYFNDPVLVKRLFDEYNLQLATLVLHQDWEGKMETDDERLLSDKAIDFVKRFPQAKIMLSHHAGKPRDEDAEKLRIRRENLISCMSSVANRAAEQGIVCAIHPNSGKYSLFRTEEDYKVMFDMIEKTSIGWVPDIGHIVNGGMNPMEQLIKHRNLIRHVHFKDWTGYNEWAVMGEGLIDYPAIIKYLADTDYKGWIIVEDESPKAVTDSDETVLMDGSYMLKQISKY